MVDIQDMQVTLKACRVNTGLSQDEFAKKVGVTLNTVYNWEKGSSEPNLSQLRTISELSTIPIGAIVVSNNPSKMD